QQVFKLGDLGEQGIVFFLNLLLFQRRKTAKLHVEDGLRLGLRQVVGAHELSAGIIGVFTLADDLDHLVQIGDGDQEAFKNVGAAASAIEVKLGAALDHVTAVVDKVAERAFERQQPRLVVDQREHLHPESGLERSVLEQLVDHL